MNLTAEIFQDADKAREHLEANRWPDGAVCPHCGSVGEATKLQGRAARPGVWQCNACREQFSVTVGTVFEKSKVPLNKWLLATYLMNSSKKGISAHQIGRTLGVTYKTAWFMCHRIREAMKRNPMAALMAGTIVADETFIGGKFKNRHAKNRRYADGNDKTAVLALVNKETGEVRSRVVANVTGSTLRSVFNEHVDVKGSTLHTDEFQSYKLIGKKFQDHQAVNHKEGEYVRDGASTNVAESYFAQLKRSIDGTHHNVSIAHLPRYLNEYDFRFSTRKLTDANRMNAIVDGMGGRRISYEPLRRY